MLTGGEAACTEFDPLETMSRKEARRADRFTQLALVAADEPLQHAGLASGQHDLPPDRTGSIVGTGIGGLPTTEDNQTTMPAPGPSAPAATSVADPPPWWPAPPAAVAAASVAPAAW